MRLAVAPTQIAPPVLNVVPIGAALTITVAPAMVFSFCSVGQPSLEAGLISARVNKRRARATPYVGSLESVAHALERCRGRHSRNAERIHFLIGKELLEPSLYL